MNGLSKRCNCSTNIWVLSRSDDWRLNSSSNLSAEAKTSGSRKLSRAQSSCKLFWSGVPVTNNRFSVFNNLTVFESCARSFLMRCASSMMRKRQGTFLRALTCVAAARSRDDAIDARRVGALARRVDATAATACFRRGTTDLDRRHFIRRETHVPGPLAREVLLHQC